jgi:hypothetical protein
LPSRRKLHFAAFGRSVEFVDCLEMADGFRSILRGWDVAEVPCTNGDVPAISFHRDDDRHLWVSKEQATPRRWKAHPPRTPEQAVCDFHYYFVNWFCRENPDLFCLHSAAVEFAAGLVVFPGVQRAGKSTLSAALARAGHTVFCDDVLPIEAGSHAGLALGLLPRLRLPLPANVSPRFRSFVAERSSLSRSHFVYLALRDAEIAPFGRTRPVCGVVSLARSPRAIATQLHPLPVATTLKHLIQQNFAESIPSLTLFEDLHDLAVKARRFELRYADLEEASRLLTDEFGSVAANVAKEATT